MASMNDSSTNWLQPPSYTDHDSTTLQILRLSVMKISRGSHDHLVVTRPFFHDSSPSYLDNSTSSVLRVCKQCLYEINQLVGFKLQFQLPLGPQVPDIRQ